MVLDDLIAFEQIKQLKARYCYYLDTKDWDGFADTLTEDVVIECDTAVATDAGGPKPVPRVVGRATQRIAIERLAAAAYTVHQVHSPIIELTSLSDAKAVWAMEDVIEKPGFFLHGRGHYHETYRKDGAGNWRIASIHLTRTHVETNGESGY